MSLTLTHISGEGDSLSRHYMYVEGLTLTHISAGGDSLSRHYMYVETHKDKKKITMCQIAFYVLAF